MIKKGLLVMLSLIIYPQNIKAANIPQAIKDAVTFIAINNNSGQSIIGTGFFVGVKNEKNPNLENIYLVTSKHILFNDNTGALFSSTVSVRLNKKTGGVQVIDIPLSGPNAATVFTHKDKDIDLAVIPIVFNPEIFDYIFVPDNLITTKKMFDDLKIGEGDDVFFTGLFIHYLGFQKNYPIWRFGKIALVTNEKIPWFQEGKGKPPIMLDLYLIDAQSFGGNSGSPVFFFLDPSRDTNSIIIGPKRILLGGIVKGFFADPVGNLNQNDGITAVIPAYKLYEILFSDEVKKARAIEK